MLWMTTILKINNLTAHYGAAQALVGAVPGIGSAYQIHLTRDNAERDHLHLCVEQAEGVNAKRGPELSHEVDHQIKKQLLVSLELELVDYFNLPRSEKKSQRVFDNRIHDEIV